MHHCDIVWACVFLLVSKSLIQYWLSQLTLLSIFEFVECMFSLDNNWREDNTEGKTTLVYDKAVSRIFGKLSATKLPHPPIPRQFVALALYSNLQMAVQLLVVSLPTWWPPTGIMHHLTHLATDWLEKEVPQCSLLSTPAVTSGWEVLCLLVLLTLGTLCGCLSVILVNHQRQQQLQLQWRWLRTGRLFCRVHIL